MTKRTIAVAALLASIALSGCRDSTGAPVSGGRVFLSRPGTQTNVVGYTGADATAAHALNQGGILLDAGGRQKIFVNEPVDVRVQTSSGVDVDTFGDPSMDAKVIQVRNAGFTGTDPVSSAQVAGGKAVLDTILTNLATSLGGADGMVKIAASATARSVNSKFSEVQVSVKDFGAVGNGVADDTVAIQAAIDYIASIGGGVVGIPPATFPISSSLAVPTTAVVTFRGAGAAVSIIRNSNTAGNAFTAPGNPNVFFRDLSITHLSSSTGTAVAFASVGTTAVGYFDNVSISGHAIGIALGVGGGRLSQAGVATSAASTSAALAANGFTTVVGGSFVTTVGIGIQATGGTTKLYGTQVVPAGGAIAGVDVAAGANLYAHGAVNTGALTLGLRAATTAAIVQHTACDWQSVTDNRTGAPVSYSFAGANNMTPLPLQAEVIRVAQSTGAVVTTINNIAAIGFKPFVLICSNTSAGASNFTFGASYVLTGAVAPAAGTRVALNLYFDPVSGKTFESGRGATAN